MLPYEPMRNLLTASVLACTLIPSFAFAQSGTDTGSGSMTASGSAVWTEREVRAENFWQAVLPFRKTEEAFFKQEALRRQKLYTHRMECTDELRKANRDTRYKTMLGCYKTDLALIKEIILKQKEYVAQVPGVTETVRSQATATADNLLDAIATIIQAIDAGVYHTEADLLEAKTNLFAKYREPHWLAISKLRIDRQLTWVALLLTQVQEIVHNETVNAEVRGKAEQVGVCLEGAEGILWQAEKTLVKQELITLPGQAKEELNRCIEMLRQAESLNKKVTQ